MIRRKESLAVGALILLGLCLIYGCLQQENTTRPQIPEERDQCVTPLQKISASLSSGGISATSDGSLFGFATNFGTICLSNNRGKILWTREGIGSRYVLLLNSGTAVLVESYNAEEPWKSTLVKLDSQGNTLWEKMTGFIEEDGLAATPDGSFIAVGATDADKNGHLMLFDGDGNTMWNHQSDVRINAVAVSKNGYVVAGTRDMVVRVYDCHGEVIFSFSSGKFYDTQETAISPDESFFLCYSTGI